MIDARHVAEAWGSLAFRAITGFALTVFAFLTFDHRTTQLCLVLLIALDLASQGVTQAQEHQMKALEQRLWMDELTNRKFFEELVDTVRAGGHINVPELYKKSTTSAVSDIKSYVAAQGMFLSSASKFFAAFGTFAFNIFGYFIVYGAAYVAATFWRTGSFQIF